MTYSNDEIKIDGIDIPGFPRMALHLYLIGGGLRVEVSEGGRTTRAFVAPMLETLRLRNWADDMSSRYGQEFVRLLMEANPQFYQKPQPADGGKDV